MLSALRTSAVAALLLGSVTAAQSTAPVVSIPRLIRLEGVVQSSVQSGLVNGRFSIYREEREGSPLWTESQNLQPDANGRYTVLLGSTRDEGMPAELFLPAEPRYLEVEIAGVAQPRVLMVSVPYSIRASDADTLQGLPASAFLRSPAAVVEPASSAATDRANRLPGRDNATPLTLANNCLVLWFNASTCSMVTQDTVSGGQELIITGSQGFTNGLFYVQNTNAASGNNIATLASPGMPPGSETFFNLGVSNTPSNWVSQGFYYAGNGSAFNRYDFQFAFAPLPAFSILAGGNVGFGTIAPSQKLEVAGTGKFSGGIMFGDGSVQTTAATGGGGGGGGTVTGVTAGNGLAGGGSAGSVTLSVDTTKVPLLSANNVFSGNQTLSGTTTMTGVQGFSNGLFTVQNTNVGGNNIASLMSPNLPPGNETFFNLGVSNTPSNWVSQGFFYAGNGSASNRYDFQFAFTPQPAFSILAGGNVGFGTQTPSQKVEVNGVVKATGGIMFGDGTTQTTAATGTGGGSGNGTITAVNAGTDLTGGGTSGVVTLNVDTSKVPQLNVANNFTAQQTVSSNLNVTGNLGVGTTTPARKVEVNGDTQVDGNLYGNSNAFINGNVGIGTTTPVQKLEVAGNIQVDGGVVYGPNGVVLISTSTAAGAQLGGAQPAPPNTPGTNTSTGPGAGSGSGPHQTSMGASALFSNASTGSDNSAIGFSSLYSNTSGANNTALGSTALFSNTTGSSNTALGSAALYSNTGGIENTAVGYQALKFNTTGQRNTAFGTLAMTANTTGYNNAGTGYGALSSNTTGFGNTATGYHAVASNTTGFGNTGTGWQALLMTTGDSNTATGAGALVDNTTGSGNTAEGTSALASNTTGGQNVAIGSGAMYFNTIGGYNVAVGSNSMPLLNTGSPNTSNTALGANALVNLTTGYGNIAVGQNVGANLTSGHDNIYLWSGGPPSSGSENTTIRLGTNGYHSAAYIGGVRGVTTGVSNAIPVYIDSNGQLGTVNSSRRFKKDIEDMGSTTSNLMRLRPVTYRYKQPYADGTEPIQYGLIAEEVAEIFPDMVAHSADGQVETVKYQMLDPMLLNEVQKLYRQNQEQKKVNDEQSAEIRGLKERLARLEALITANQR